MKFPQDCPECLLVADSLQGLRKNQICQSEVLTTDLTIEVVGLFVGCAAQVVDPDRGIKITIGSLAWKSSQTRPVKIALPVNLASKSANVGLCSSLNQ